MDDRLAVNPRTDRRMPDTYCLRPTLDRREVRVGVGLQNDITERVFKIM